MKPFAHIVYRDTPEPTIQLGKMGGTFSGTDALQRNAQPAVEAWLTAEDFQFTTVYLEGGDKLANIGFFTRMREAGWDVRVVYVNCDPAVAAQRRADRGDRTDRDWLRFVRGLQTKMRNLLRDLAASGFPIVEIDTAQMGDAAIVGRLRRLGRNPHEEQGAA